MLRVQYYHAHLTNRLRSLMQQDFEETTEILALDLKIVPKVLVIDDDELVREQLRGVIAGAGFEVRAAADALAGLDFLQKEFTPIVITDRNMPGMDGLALCRHIRRQHYPGYVYLMLLTVQDAEDDILAGLDAGADDYLSKRASTAQLVARLRTAQRILTLEQSLKIASEERRRLAMTDMLTGAHNRRYFMRHLDRELKRVRRFGGELSLLALDIDHFKQVNDRYGHAAGDSVLREFVQRIQKCLPRDFDWCARLGGEEFAVVLPQTDLAGASVVAERLRVAVEGAPMHTAAGTLSITVSIGASGLQAMADREAATAEMLLAHADRYLYTSKQTGRNRVSLPDLKGRSAHA
jgi:two-component system, cell cycle response regulator